MNVCSCIHDPDNYTIPIAMLLLYIEEERARCPVHMGSTQQETGAAEIRGDLTCPPPVAPPPDKGAYPLVGDGMKVGSLFSGVGGFDLGLERAGFEVAWQAENDPFCNKVLAAHWPEVRRFSDVRDVGCHGKHAERGASSESGKSPNEWRRQAGSGIPDGVDLICGGFPCQDLSVAGKRAGLSGERSGLWFEFHRILSELRPAACLIENVPGLLSSNQGRDFGVILAGLDDIWPGRWGWAVLDSQHFGVPQRRRRLYVIAGPPRERIAQVLSLCESGDWNTETRRTAGEDVALPLGANATSFGGQRYDLDHETYVPDIAWALQERDAKGADSDTKDGHLIVDHRRASAGIHGDLLEGGSLALAHSLRAEGFDASEDGTGRGTPLVAQPLRSNRWGGSDSHGDQGNVIAVRTAQTGSNGWGVDEEGLAYALDGANGQAVSTSTVRRLTPTECERLQGFPDDWTAFGADGPRYRALGNAVSVPVIEYIGLRLREVLTP